MIINKEYENLLKLIKIFIHACHNLLFNSCKILFVIKRIVNFFLFFKPLFTAYTYSYLIYSPLILIDN